MPPPSRSSPGRRLTKRAAEEGERAAPGVLGCFAVVGAGARVVEEGVVGALVDVYVHVLAPLLEGVGDLAHALVGDAVVRLAVEALDGQGHLVDALHRHGSAVVGGARVDRARSG